MSGPVHSGRSPREHTNMAALLARLVMKPQGRLDTEVLFRSVCQVLPLREELCDLKIFNHPCLSSQITKKSTQ